LASIEREGDRWRGDRSFGCLGEATEHEGGPGRGEGHRSASFGSSREATGPEGRQGIRLPGQGEGSATEEERLIGWGNREG
jgi:hypothetical protein